MTFGPAANVGRELSSLERFGPVLDALPGPSYLVGGTVRDLLLRRPPRFDFALAVGFLFVGWRPVRAYGMLPLVAALVGCLGITTAVDLARGTASLLGESAHLLDLMGLASVWELARTEGPPRPEGHRGHGRLTPVG